MAKRAGILGRERAGLLDRLFLQDREGLVVRRRDDVARLRAEAFGRVEALDFAGSVAHATGPLESLSEPPFVPAWPA